MKTTDDVILMSAEESIIIDRSELKDKEIDMELMKSLGAKEEDLQNE